MGNVSEEQRSEFMKSTTIFSGAILIVGALCVSGCVSESSLNEVTGVTVDDYEPRVFTSSQDDTIQYRLFIPRDYKPDTKYPLVLQIGIVRWYCSIMAPAAQETTIAAISKDHVPWNGPDQKDRQTTPALLSHRKYRGENRGKEEMAHPGRR